MTPVDPCVDKKFLFSKTKMWGKFADQVLTGDNPGSNYSQVSPYIVSLLDIAYYIGISPGRVCKSDSTDLYVWKRPGKLRKVTCALWHLLILANIYPDLKQTAEGGNMPNVIKMIYQIAYFLYLLYIASFLFSFWTQMELLVDTLNETVLVSLEAELDVGKREKECRIFRCISARVTNVILKYGIVVFIVVLWGFMNNTPETLKNVWEQLFLEESGIHGLLSESGRFVINFLENPFGPMSATQITAIAMSSTFNQSNNRSSPASKYSEWFVQTLGLLYLFVDVCNSACWISADLSITLWSHNFRKLFDMILAQESKMKTRKICLKTVMLFSKTSYLIQKFSNATGFIVLTCVISETLYISTQTSVLLTGRTISLQMLITSIMSFLPFLTVLLCSAGVNYRAGEFSYFLKEKFLTCDNRHPFHNIPNKGGANMLQTVNIDTRGGAPEAQGKYLFHENYSLKEDIDRGLMIIFHDLATNLIGIQGYFFTISYAFMGTVLSGIFTYTVVALQLVSSIEE